MKSTFFLLPALVALGAFAEEEAKVSYKIETCTKEEVKGNIYVEEGCEGVALPVSVSPDNCGNIGEAFSVSIECDGDKADVELYEGKDCKTKYSKSTDELKTCIAGASHVIAATSILAAALTFAGLN